MNQNNKLSPGYLGKLFRSHTQLSFNDYLKKIRLEEATRLLTTTNDSIAVISESVGVLNTTYFFTLFKKTYGISPAQYREQHTK
ncbi:helix-turn-helix transcriptional regulator [Paenibacillus sp. FSL K6-3182]|uniref:helix-turn-helix domain-containing protein n=1 Tax=Paenibacillus sp. FSL K6-3182 TaxID=2921495 RepID=UPI0030CFEA4B